MEQAAEDLQEAVKRNGLGVLHTVDLTQTLSDKGAPIEDERLELSTVMAACLRDDRQQAKVAHAYEEIFRQRMFGMACGYADGNDAARIANDPVFKLLAGRDPVTPKFIYEKVYCPRGDIENRIKELKHGLDIDRTSCTSFKANQLRVLMTAAAYVLMQDAGAAHPGGNQACFEARWGSAYRRLPALIGEVGFQCVQKTAEWAAPLGTIALLTAVKS